LPAPLTVVLSVQTDADALYCGTCVTLKTVVALVFSN
jgi:hypothetical protein